MERARRRALETVLGLALVAALVLGVVVIFKSFSGDFSSDIEVSARLSKVGDALEPGDIVTYRDMVVGQVTSAAGSLRRHGRAGAEDPPRRCGRDPGGRHGGGGARVAVRGHEGRAHSAAGHRRSEAPRRTT